MLFDIPGHFRCLAAELELKLGSDHEFKELLQSVFDDYNDACALDVIIHICDNPKIQKMYFPIYIDAKAQSEWCQHYMCQFHRVPERRLLDMHALSNSSEKKQD